MNESADPPHERAAESQPAPNRIPPRRERMPLAAAMLMIVGLGIGAWYVSGDVRRIVSGQPGAPEPTMLTERWRKWEEVALYVIIGALGGLSLVGPPLLLWERWTRRRPWGDGRLFWFAQGTSSWLLWPPVIARRLTNAPEPLINETMSGLCYFYGTPLMALYVTLALLAGGRLRRSRRRRAKRSWQERFGLLLGLAWACTGLYILSIIYRNDFQR